MDLYCTPRSQVVHQARQVSTGSFPLPGGHLKGVQGQVCEHWSVGGLPAHDSPREDIGDEGDVDPPGEGAYVGGGTSRLRGNVGDLQLVRPERVEMPFDEVGRALLSRRAARGARGPGATDAAQAQVAHEPHGRCTGPRDRHRDAQRPQVGPVSRASCGPPAPG